MNAWVMNFANTIVGVGILAVPFCFHVCGIGMAVLMILATNVLTRKTCEYLLKAGHLTRKNGYELIAQHHLGGIGKLVTELGIIGLMLGTLISFQVVIGDLAPALISSAFGIEQTWSLRTFLMCLSSLGVIPLALMRNISSLANMNAMSMGFYCLFVIMVILMSLKNLTSGLWSLHVNFWRPEGFFHCLPIISLSFSCQSQVLIMYEAIPEQSVNIMMGIIDRAIHLVTVMYLSVGFFGYVAFYETGIRGDILANFSSGLLADTIKTGFWISIIISFPLIIFPLRLSLHSLFFTKKNSSQDIVSSAADYIPQDRFTSITVLIVTGTLVIGILIPHIETVLSITGAFVGTFLCFVFPSALYILSTAKDNNTRTTAKAIFIISIIGMIASTLAVLSANDTHANTDHKGHPGHEGALDGKQVPVTAKPFELPVNLLTTGSAGNVDDGGGGDGDTQNKKRVDEPDIKPVEKSVEEFKEQSEKGSQTDSQGANVDANEAAKVNVKQPAEEKQGKADEVKAVVKEAEKTTHAPGNEVVDLKGGEKADLKAEDETERMKNLANGIMLAGGNANIIKSREIKALNESADGGKNTRESRQAEKLQSHKKVENFASMVVPRATPGSENSTTIGNSIEEKYPTEMYARNNV